MLPDFPLKSFALNAPTRSHLYSHAFITNALRFVWVLIAIGGELGAFFWSLAGCRWPTVDLGHKKRQAVDQAHVLLIGDPQVQHPALTVKGSRWANPIRRILLELNLRKSWHVTSRLRPDAVVFLGDMLANGKSAENFEEYEQAAQKFKNIFPMDEGTEVYHIPGNNDVGLGPASAKSLRSFYVKSFGPLNQRFVISNHTFVALDAPGLVEEDYLRHSKGMTYDDWTPVSDGPVAFVKEVSDYGPGHVILLSHIPLSRSETANCGPLRERGTIRRGAGPGYQTLLGKQTTHFLLDNLEPVVVFSADNRDYCEYTHAIPNHRSPYKGTTNIREITLKSFSISVHIKRPGFQLLSLVDPAKVANPSLPTYSDALCLLPDQYQIYTSLYAPFFFATLVILFLLNFRASRLGLALGLGPGARGLKKIKTSLSPSPRGSGRNSPNNNTLVQPESAIWTPFSAVHPVSPRASTIPVYLRTPRSQSSPTMHLVASRPGTPGPSSPTLTLPKPFGDWGDEDDEDDDTMFPAQYSVRRDTGYGHDGWSHVSRHHRAESSEEYEIVRDPEAGGGTGGGSSALDQLVSSATATATMGAASPRGAHTEFISVPEPHASSTMGMGAAAARSRAQKRWTWTYTFVFRGRRRRMTIGLPSWAALHNLLDLFGLAPPPPGSGVVGVLGFRRRKGGVTALTIDMLSVFWPAVVVWVIINWAVL